MLLHTHQIVENDETVPVYVVHATPTEAKALVAALANAIDSNPDVDSYAITLGRVQDLDERIPVEGAHPDNGLIVPADNGLILPGQ